MKVILEPLSGPAKDNLDRASVEMNSVLNFRGSVSGVKAKADRIIVAFEINPAWDLPMSKKVESLNVRPLCRAAGN